MKKILVVNGNPKIKSFCKDLCESYALEAKRSKHQVRMVEIGTLKFDPFLREGYSKIQKLEEDLKGFQKDVSWADHLVFVFPTWWGSLPAIFKGLFDRAFLPGFAFQFDDEKLMPEKLLKGKSARLITTMDAPVWIHKYYFGAPGMKVLDKTILRFCGVKPIRRTFIGRVSKIGDKARKSWIERVSKLGLRGI